MLKILNTASFTFKLAQSRIKVIQRNKSVTILSTFEMQNTTSKRLCVRGTQHREMSSDVLLLMLFGLLF